MDWHAALAVAPFDEVGHVGDQALGLVTLVGLVTIAASTSMITYSHQLHTLCEPLLGVFERRGSLRESERDGVGDRAQPSVLLFGLGGFGTAIGLRLRNHGMAFLGVDFNPAAVRRWRDLGLPACYGDAGDPEILAGLPLKSAASVVSTMPIHPTGLTDIDPRVVLAQNARASGFPARLWSPRMDAASRRRLVGTRQTLFWSYSKMPRIEPLSCCAAQRWRRDRASSLWATRSRI